MCRTTRKTTDYKLNITGKKMRTVTFMAAYRNFIGGVP